MEQKDYIDLIVLELLKSKQHLRELARNLHVNPMTISRKLAYLRKENIVDYKSEGRNKIYLLKKNILARKFVIQAEQKKFHMLLQKYPEMMILVEEILNKSREKLIILFGSYAKFTAKKDSDIDLYIDTENKKVKEEIEKINSKISVKIGLFNLNSHLIKEIIANHIILRGVEEYYDKIKFFE
jgi:predicted nucleotidyltransferase